MNADGLQVCVCMHVTTQVMKLTINIHTQFVDKVLDEVQISSVNRELQYLS